MKTISKIFLTSILVALLALITWGIYKGLQHEFRHLSDRGISMAFISAGIILGLAILFFCLLNREIWKNRGSKPAAAELLKSLSITRKPMGSRNPLTLPTTICAVSVGLIAAVMALMYFFDIQTPQ